MYYLCFSCFATLFPGSCQCSCGFLVWCSVFLFCLSCLFYLAYLLYCWLCLFCCHYCMCLLCWYLCLASWLVFVCFSLYLYVSELSYCISLAPNTEYLVVESQCVTASPIVKDVRLYVEDWISLNHFIKMSQSGNIQVASAKMDGSDNHSLRLSMENLRLRDERINDDMENHSTHEVKHQVSTQNNDSNHQESDAKLADEKRQVQDVSTWW